MAFFTMRYSHAITKQYDGTTGSSSLWSMRMSKAYGSLPLKADHNPNGSNLIFDYTNDQISLARRFRSGFYQRILDPIDIRYALQFTPVVLDFEMFDSIFSDVNGVISMPDLEEDKKSEFAHSVSVMGWDKDGYEILNNWRGWGVNNMGYISLEYLNKYFLTAFAAHHLWVLSDKPRPIERKRVQINGSRYTYSIYRVVSLTGRNNALFDIDLISGSGDVVGWIHFECKKRVLEILDLFILKEFRNKGLGSFLLNKARDYSSSQETTGYIAAQDLLEDREESVKSFLIKNDLTIAVDKSMFKDCRGRIIGL